MFNSLKQSISSLNKKEDVSYFLCTACGEVCDFKQLGPHTINCQEECDDEDNRFLKISKEQYDAMIDNKKKSKQLNSNSGRNSKSEHNNINNKQTDESVQDILYTCSMCNTTINWDFSAHPDFECPICDNTTYTKVKQGEIIDNDDTKINDSIPDSYIDNNNNLHEDNIIIEEEKIETPSTKKKKSKKKKRSKKLNNIYICNNCSTRVQIDEFEGYEIYCPECNCSEFTKEGDEGDNLTGTLSETLTDTLTDTLKDTTDENPFNNDIITDDTKENDRLLDDNKISDDVNENSSNKLPSNQNITNDFEGISHSNNEYSQTSTSISITKDNDISKDKQTNFRAETTPEPPIINEIIDKGKRILYKCTKCDKVSYIFENLLSGTKCERCNNSSWQNLDEDNDDSDVDDDLSDDDFKMTNNKSKPSASNNLSNINKTNIITKDIKPSDNKIISDDNIERPNNVVNKSNETKEIDDGSDDGNPFGDDEDEIPQQISDNNKPNVIEINETAERIDLQSDNHDTSVLNAGDEIDLNDKLIDGIENIDGDIPDDGADYDSYIDSLIDKQLGVNIDSKSSTDNKKETRDTTLKSASNVVGDEVETVVDSSVKTDDNMDNDGKLVDDAEIHLSHDELGNISDDESGDEILDMFLNKYGDDDIKKDRPTVPKTEANQPHKNVEKIELKTDHDKFEKNPPKNDNIDTTLPTKNKIGAKRLTLAEMKKQLKESVLEEIQQIDDNDLVEQSKPTTQTDESDGHNQNYRKDNKVVDDKNESNVQNINNNKRENININQQDKINDKLENLSDKSDDQENISDTKKQTNKLANVRDNPDSDGQKEDGNKFLRQSQSANADKPRFDFQTSMSRDINRTIPSLSFRDILDADEEETAALKKTITLQSCKPKPPNLHDAPDKVRILDESTPITQSRNEPHNPFDNDDVANNDQDNSNENPFDDKRYLSQSTRIQPSQSVNTELIEEAELKLAQSTRVIGHTDPFSSVRSQPVRRVGTRTKYLTMDLNEESQSNSFVKQMIVGIPAVKFCRWGPSHKTVLRFIEDPGKRVLLQWERKKYFRKSFATIYFDEVTLIRDDQGKRITFITPKRVLEIEFDSPQSKKKYYEDFMSFFNIGGNP